MSPTQPDETQKRPWATEAPDDVERAERFRRRDAWGGLIIGLLIALLAGTR